ncbi:MAG: tRNA (adenosine(37)-N6)-threonylcarbamoyltransferase complex ATPase subunit type 1 TsaE [Minisyncoccia bacterium]
MRIKIFSENPKETQKIAALFINTILKQKDLKRRQALVISLEGNLGSGKTEFLKGIASGSKLKGHIFSPTFLIMKRFPLSYQSFKFLWHWDCYRLKSIKELKELDFLTILNDPQNIVFIEWGNKIKHFLPKNHWTIKFQILGEKKRSLTITDNK